MSSIDTASNPFNYKGGDVKIKVKYKGEEMEGMVATQVMVLASPVWNKFLFQPWSTEAFKVKEIDFREDDGEAILILLNIAHLQSRRVPKELDYKILYRIAILCEQYDCHALVDSWLAGWTKNEDIGPTNLIEVEWIYIDWAFGRDKFFVRRVESLVRVLKISLDGKPSTLAGREFPTVMPDKLLERVIAVRETTIQKMLDIIYREAENYMHGKRTLCKCSEDQQSCDAASYGGLILALGREELWPPISAKDYKESMVRLLVTVTQLKVAPYQEPASRPQQQDHRKCGALYLVIGPSISLYTAKPDVVEECHVRHMKLRNGTADLADRQIPRCVRCNTAHVFKEKCPPNPRKRSSE